MPGMFGVIGLTPEARELCRSLFAAPWHKVEVHASGSAIFGAHSHSGTCFARRDNEVVAIDGAVSLYERLARSAEQLWTVDASGAGVTSACHGNVAVWNEHSERLMIATEPTGSFPLYYAHRAGAGFLFSSRMAVVAAAIKPAVDPVGVVEFLREAAFQSNRSLWNGIGRVQQGQSLVYDAEEDRLTVVERSRLWTSIDARDLVREDIVSRTWSLLGQAIDVDAPTTIMMSGGWDSRTLLARLLASAPTDRVLGYSHGDPASREIRLAQHLAGETGIAFHQEPIDYRCYEISDLRLGFAREEHIVFPHWHRAGRLAATPDPRVVTAGVYGEILGGHYGRAMLLQGGAKIREVLSGLLSTRTHRAKASPSELAAVAEFLHLSHLDRPWPVREEWWDAVGVGADALNADVDQDLTRLTNRGIDAIEPLIEAYVSEHRGSQYINAQIRSCRAYTDVSLPFTDGALLEWACGLPLSAKIHNRLNQQLLREFAPELLRYPMAATLASARSPLLIQEASRFARKALEVAGQRLRATSGGTARRPRLSWVNFDFLRSGAELGAIVEDLKADLWDRPALLRRIAQLATDDAVPTHPLSDQIMKVYTIDLGLSVV